MSIDQYLEKSEKQEKEISRLMKEMEESQVHLEKLQEFEQKSQELLSQAAVHSETISTLQKDLVSEKLNNEKFRASLEKLGLTLDVFDNDINAVVEKMLSNPEIEKCVSALFNEKDSETKKEKCSNCVETQKLLETNVYSQAEQVVSSISAEWNQQCEKLLGEVSALQQLNEALQGDNARMQVDIATLTSQVNSLSTQQTALQLANSQLVAEKEEVRVQKYCFFNQINTFFLVGETTADPKFSARYLAVGSDDVKDSTRAIEFRI